MWSAILRRAARRPPVECEARVEVPYAISGMMRMATMFATLIIGLIAGPGGVLVRVADGVAGDRRLVGQRALAAERAVLDQLLRVVPGAAAGGHRDGHEQADDDDADQQAAERLDGQESDDERDRRSGSATG